MFPVLNKSRSIAKKAFEKAFAIILTVLRTEKERERHNKKDNELKKYNGRSLWDFASS